MIRTVRIEVNAAYPDMPLERAAVYTGSAASFTIINVPRKHGSREITGVAVSVTSVAEVTQSFAAVRDGCAWNVTVPASAIGASGKVTRGLVVTASGTDENGAAVSCWVLGCGDIEILPLDAQPSPGETAITLRGFDETPSAPAKWNVRRSDGGFEIFYGDAWLPLGGGGDMKHSEFADLNAPDNMTQKESNALLQTIVSRLKGSTPMLLAPFLVLASLLASAVPLSPSTDFGDVNPTNKLGEVVSAAGAVDTNAVINIANATIETNDTVKALSSSVSGLQSSKANRAEYGDADEIATLDADGNPTRSGIAKANVATKTDLDDYLPLTGGELSGGVYAQQAIASATTVGAQTIDAWADIRLGSETYYLHNEDECLADYNGKFAHESMISATDPTFSNAVLAVGINTNTVAQIGELKQFFDDLPTGTVGTSIGGIILALLGAAAFLKKKTALLENDGKATDAFATDLLGKPVAKEAIDERLPIPISEKSTGFTTESYKRFIVTVSGDMTVTLHTPTSGDAEIFECRFNGTSLSADASISFDGATATTMDANCGTVTAGKIALMSAFWNGSTWDVNWKVEG